LHASNVRLLTVTVHFILIHSFYLIQSSPLPNHYLILPPQVNFPRSFTLLPCRQLRRQITMSILSNQLSSFFSCPINFIHVTKSPHRLSFLSAKLFLQHSSPLFTAIESTSRLLINKSASIIMLLSFIA